MGAFTGRERDANATAHAEQKKNPTPSAPGFWDGVQNNATVSGMGGIIGLACAVHYEVGYTFDPAFGDPGAVEQTTTFRTRVEVVSSAAGGSWTDNFYSAPETLGPLVIPAGYNWSNWSTDYGDA